MSDRVGWCAFLCALEISVARSVCRGYLGGMGWEFGCAGKENVGGSSGIWCGRENKGKDGKGWEREEGGGSGSGREGGGVGKVGLLMGY